MAYYPQQAPSPELVARMAGLTRYTHAEIAAAIEAANTVAEQARAALEEASDLLAPWQIGAGFRWDTPAVVLAVWDALLAFNAAPAVIVEMSKTGDVWPVAKWQRNARQVAKTTRALEAANRAAQAALAATAI